MTESPENLRCWALSEGHAGMVIQCVGLAERVGIPFQELRVLPRRPWTWLPPGWWPAPQMALGPDSDRIAPPWPELAITCGRRSVPYGLMLRRLSGGRTFTVHIQDPQTRLKKFDLVVAPKHDGLRGANVIETSGSLHRVTPERLAAAAAKVAAKLESLPRPLVTVLVGGSNSCYQLTPAITAALADDLAELSRRDGIGLAVTPSRRTGADNIAVLRERLAAVPAVVWDLEGENPYFGFLGQADYIVVTPDSVNMATEAAATGKPVFVAELAGGNAKFRAFHQNMRTAGYTRPFAGRLDSWTYEPLDDTATVAAEIKRRMDQRNI